MPFAMKLNPGLASNTAAIVVREKTTLSDGGVERPRPHSAEMLARRSRCERDVQYRTIGAERQFRTAVAASFAQ